MNDQEREEALRRLMADAVEPLRPAPGSQARLMARIEAAEAEAQLRAGNATRKAKSSRWRISPASLGWSGAGLSAAAVVAVAVFFATHSSQTSSGASSGASSVAAAPSAQAAAGSSSAASSAPNAPVPEKQPTLRSVGNDLDGDGAPDVFTLNGNTLSAQLSRDGQQEVALPATGSGAQVLGVTLLQTPAGSRVPVVRVRLVATPGFSQDALAALVDGRLTVLRFGAQAAQPDQPAVLTVDATHGYACSDGELAVAGNPAAYTVQGAELVASPRLRAVDAPPGQATGC